MPNHARSARSAVARLGRAVTSEPTDAEACDGRLLGRFVASRDVGDVDAKEGPTDPIIPTVRWASAVWSGDGTKLYVSRVAPEKQYDPREAGKRVPLVCSVVNLADGKEIPLGLPPGYEIADLSPDGKSLLTRTFDSMDKWPVRRSSSRLTPSSPGR